MISKLVAYVLVCVLTLLFTAPLFAIAPTIVDKFERLIYVLEHQR